MRDVMRRWRNTPGKATRPATYTDDNGMVHQVPVRHSMLVSNPIPRHRGKADEAIMSCPCADCRAAYGTQWEEAPSPTRASKLAQHKVVSNSHKPATVLRRRPSPA